MKRDYLTNCARLQAEGGEEVSAAKSSISRRGLFGLLAGASALPFIKVAAPARTVIAETVFHTHSSFQRYSGYQVLNITPADIRAAMDFHYCLRS